MCIPPQRPGENTGTMDQLHKVSMNDGQNSFSWPQDNPVDLSICMPSKFETIYNSDGQHDEDLDSWIQHCMYLCMGVLRFCNGD